MTDSQALPDEDPGTGPEAEAYDMEGTDSDAEAYPASMRCVLHAHSQLESQTLDQVQFVGELKYEIKAYDMESKDFNPEAHEMRLMHRRWPLEVGRAGAA